MSLNPRWLVLSTIYFGLFLLLFMIAQILIAAAVVMFLEGLASTTYRTMSRLTLQTRMPDRLRGRILSIALMDRGLVPLGAILIGVVADWAGALWAGVVMGAVALPSRWRCSLPVDRSGACRA